jgi:4-aminobutyrate aminotransferase-like enzyme
MCLTFARETFQRGVAGKPAGVIVEPIQASGGQLILPKRYLEGLRKLCDEYETLLVFDEIQTFGRIGRMFAADYFGVTPDIIVLGKAIGGGLPLAAVIVSDKLKGFDADIEELHTFASPTLSMVTGAKLIELLEESLLENCRTMGQYIADGVRRMVGEFPEIGDIRQAGLHIGIEFVKDPASKEPIPTETVAIRDAGLRNGVIFGLGGVRRNVLKIKPPLIVSRPEADEILEVFERSVKQVLRK